jgi:hypothetical protein
MSMMRAIGHGQLRVARRLAARVVAGARAALVDRHQVRLALDPDRDGVLRGAAVTPEEGAHDLHRRIGHAVLHVGRVEDDHAVVGSATRAGLASPWPKSSRTAGCRPP